MREKGKREQMKCEGLNEALRTLMASRCVTVVDLSVVLGVPGCRDAFVKRTLRRCVSL